MQQANREENLNLATGRRQTTAHPHRHAHSYFLQASVNNVSAPNDYKQLRGLIYIATKVIQLTTVRKNRWKCHSVTHQLQIPDHRVHFALTSRKNEFLTHNLVVSAQARLLLKMDGTELVSRLRIHTPAKHQLLV